MLKRLIIGILIIGVLASFVACSGEESTEKTDVAADTVDTVSEVDTTVNTQAATEEKKWEIPEDVELTDTQREAAESAVEHLNGAGISRTTLVNVLIDEGHSNEDAEYVADIFDIDWKEMARGTAEFYTYYMPFSYQGIIDHLIYMNFTEAEANYGAEQLEIDWDSMAEKYIEKYYLYGSFSNDEIITELEKAGFTNEQAVTGLQNYEAAQAEDSSLREELGLDGSSTVNFAELTGDSSEDDGINITIIIVIAAGVLVAAGAISAIVVFTKSKSKGNKKKKNNKNKR